MGAAPVSPRSTASFALRDLATGKVYPLTDGFIIGRTTGNLVVGQDGKASGRHCALGISNGSIYVQDLNSSNGTFVNGARVQAGRPHAIAPNAVLQVGNTSFRLEGPQAAQAPTPARPANPAPLRPVPQGGFPPNPRPVFTPASALSEERPDMAYTLIALNVIVFGVLVAFRGLDFFDPTPESLIASGGNIFGVTSQNQWWRLVSAMFMHGGIMHLLSNMLGLYFGGRVLTQAVGNFKFAIVYLGAGLFGGVASLAFNSIHIVSVGASGAIFGCFGGILLLQILKRVDMKELGPFGYLSTIQFIGTNLGVGKAGIDVAAHAGGLTAGFLLTLLLVADESDENTARPWLVALGTLCTVAGLCLFLKKEKTVSPVANFDSAQIETSGLIRIGQDFGRTGHVMAEAARSAKTGLISTKEFIERLKGLRLDLAALLKATQEYQPRNANESQIKEILRRLILVQSETIRLIVGGMEGTIRDSGATLDGLEIQLHRHLELFKRTMSGETVELPDFSLSPAEVSQIPTAPIPSAPPIRQAPPAPAVVTHETPAYGDPAGICRASMNRYARVTASAMTLCRQANAYSARAMDVYTSIYTAGMGGDLLRAIFRIDNQSKLDCAAQIARRYSRRMTAKYLEKTCL